MTDTPYKRTFLQAEPDLASSLALSHPSELLRPPVARAARAQDTILSGRRVLAARHMGGSGAFLVDGTATGGASQSKPEPDVWREVLVARTELTAGSVLVLRVVAVPSGQTEEFVVAMGTWEAAGLGGQLRAEVQHDNGTDTDTTTTIVTLDDANAEDGAEQTEAGAAWQALDVHVRELIRPEAASNSLAEAAKWSEWPTVTITISDRGGARVVQATLAEEPLEHVVADDVTASSCNGVLPSGNWPNEIPLEEDPDGATYEENRHGIHRGMAVAERQEARVGTRIAHWGSYAEGLAAVDDTVPDPKVISSGTLERVSAGSNSSWDADAVGFDIMESLRAPECLSTRLDGAGAIPVRVRVYCRFQGAGAETGEFRVQTSSRSWVRVELDQATIGTTFRWVETTGWLECPVASDDWYTNLQDFAENDVEKIEIRYWDVTFADYPAGI